MRAKCPLFNQPENISLDSSGNLYVTDNGNAAIRKVTSAGVVTTLALQQTTTTPVIPVPAGSSASSSSSAGSTSGTASGSSSGSGGGGAIDPAFVVALLALAAVGRRRQLRSARQL